MAKSRLQTVLAIMVIGVGLVITAITGLWIYVSATTQPLHPDAAAVSAVTTTSSSPQWAAAIDRARQIMRADIVEQNLPGVSVAVGIDGAIVWAEGFGWADLENKTPVTPETRFRIGTASMSLTSAAAGVLIEKDRLKLDAEIQTYVPEYPKKPWPVTVRQLMGHVAGVRNDAGDEGPFGEHCDRTIDGLRLFADRDLLFEPETRFRVSSFGWILVSAAIEAAANQSFMTFMQEHVLAPLAMHATRPDSATEHMLDRATSYFPRFAADTRYGPQLARDPESPLDFSCYAGANNFVSTPADLVRFGMAMNGGALLQPATVQLLQATQRLRSGEATEYGLGWDLETASIDGEQVVLVGHDGTVMGGVASTLLIFRERGIVVSLISNTSYADTYGTGVKVLEVFARQKKGAGAGKD